MSHRAHVAIQRGPDSYDLYYSHNGAHNLQLLEQLRENADALCNSSTSPSSLGLSTQNVPTVQKWDTEVASGGQEYVSRLGDDIDSSPHATDLPAHLVGAPTEYDNIEAFYLVEDGSVTPYVPIWMWPNVIRPLRNALEIEVYRGGRLDKDPAQMVERLADTDPLAVIDEDTLGRGSDWLSNNVISTILREHHAAIIALWRMQLDEGIPERRAQEADEGEPPEPSGIVHLENYIVQFRVLDPEQTPPPSTGLGMLVELPPTATEADREDVWFRGSKTRFNISAGMNAMRSEPDDDDIVGGISDIFIELYEEFGNRISPRSPPPTGMLVRELERMRETQPTDDYDDPADAVSQGAIRDLLSGRGPDAGPDSLDLG